MRFQTELIFTHCFLLMWAFIFIFKKLQTFTVPYFLFLILPLMRHFCISPLLPALLQFKGFTRSVIVKVEARFSFQQLACSRPVRLWNCLTTQLSIQTEVHTTDVHAQTHTCTHEYTSMLDRKRKWLFSIWRATNKRCCRPISDSSPLKEPLCLWIWRWGFRREGEEERGEKTEGGRDQSVKKEGARERFCVFEVLFLPALWPLAGFTHWI